MEYQQVSSVSPAAPFSRKLSNGRGYGGKHVYDGVFGGGGGGGEVKLGSRVEDYREIFGGFGAAGSSIPILEVPELNENSKVSAVRAQRIDYGKIFGGFGDDDFGLPHEDVFAKPKKVKSSVNGTRPPAEARLRNAGSKHSNVSKEKKGSSPEPSFQKLDGVKQFNVSYNKSNPVKKYGTNGMTHVAQLHAVPGYTSLVDETIPSKMAEGGKPARSVLNDAHLNVNGSKSVKEDTARRKPVSGPQPSIDTHSFRSPKKSSRTRSISNDMPFDAFEIGLGKHPPSSSPSNSSYNNGVANKSMNSKFGVSGNDVSRGALGNHSPTFSDEEMDANSDAAASAAALRKAIEEAQMRIKIAKELMERKKEGLQNRAKTSFDNGWKAQKSEVKTTERSKRSNELFDREMHVKENTPKQEFTGLSEHNATKASQLAQNFENEKKCSFANNVGETHSMESKSTRTDNRLEEEDSESTEEFFEAADYEEHRETPSEYEEAGNAEKMASYDHENKWREKMTAEEKIKMPECGEEAFKEHKVEREPNSVVGAFQWNLYANFVKPARELHNQEENEKMRMSNNHEEAEQTSIVSDEWKDSETKLEKLHQQDKKAELPIQELEENKDMKELKDVQDSVEIEKKQREALDHKEMENGSDEVPIREEYVGSLDDIHEKKANVEEQEANWDMVERGMKLGGWNLEENEEKRNDLHRGEILGEDGGTEGNAKLVETKEDGEILKRSDQMNGTEKKREKIREGIETEKIRSESLLGKEDEKTIEVTEQALRCEGGNLEMAKDANEQGKNENLGGSDNVGLAINFAVGDLKAKVLTVKESGRLMEVTEFSPPLQGTEKESNAIGNANSPEEQNCEITGLAQGFSGLDWMKKQTADVTEALLIGRNGVYFGKNDINFGSKQNHHVTGYKGMSNQEKCLEDVTIELDDDNDVDICEPEVGTNNEESEKSSISSHNERWSDDETESLHDPECCVEEVACEFGENNKNIKESGGITNHEKDEDSFESSHEDRWVDNVIDNKASQQPCIFEGQGKTIEIAVEEELSQSISKKEENCCKNLAMEEEVAEDRWVDDGIDTKASQQPCIFEGQGKTTEIPVEEELSQGTSKKEEEKEAEDNLQKQVEVEKKHSRKKEEVKERDIEREKERIAVERAIREARERAFAEARERAAVERATAEAHQRLKAEVRERLEKAPSETNNKLAAEKASFEAKLKAERAAVERATAEARQRALEKALSEKAAFEVRNQAEKSTAERLSSMSNANGMNSRDKTYNDPGPSSSSRYPGSSNHGERFNGGNGESAQRSKATLERHQRTAERAAKVLAEKNMRDLLVQKEQAERNRLAETLDADVKRWSSGKERNLRALLSTLQYILGRDSGWQSIPLTELISSTAVKKAYRKATLFVHPDKLQQRGASIQQKYTCEKVFDLLKDAWNKFSAEER